MIRQEVFIDSSFPVSLKQILSSPQVITPQTYVDSTEKPTLFATPEPTRFAEEDGCYFYGHEFGNFMDGRKYIKSIIQHKNNPQLQMTQIFYPLVNYKPDTFTFRVDIADKQFCIATYVRDLYLIGNIGLYPCTVWEGIDKLVTLQSRDDERFEQLNERIAQGVDGFEYVFNQNGINYSATVPFMLEKEQTEFLTYYFSRPDFPLSTEEIPFRPAELNFFVEMEINE